MKERRYPTETRREQLADATLHILGEGGAGALTVKEIAQAVGITDAAVFRHFESKQALLDASLERFESFLTPLPRGEKDPVARLGRFFVERVAAVKRHPDILRLAFTDRLEQVVGDAGAARLKGHMKRSVAFVRRCIREAQAAGELDGRLDPEALGWMVTGAMRGAATSRRDPEIAWREVRRALFKRRK